MTCPLYSVFHVVLSTQSLPVPRNAKSYQFGCGCADRAVLPVGLQFSETSCHLRQSATALRWDIAPRSARTYRAKSTNSSRSGKDDRLIMRQALCSDNIGV